MLERMEVGYGNGGGGGVNALSQSVLEGRAGEEVCLVCERQM